MGWASANCFHEKVGSTNSTLGRETTNDVILWPRLKAAIEKLNPGIANDAVQLAMDRSAMSLAHANREIYQLLKNGMRNRLSRVDGLAAVVESQVAMLEEFFESAVELGGIDVVLIAQIGDRNLVEEMTLEDGNLIGAIKMTTLLGHEEPPFGLN